MMIEEDKSNPLSGPRRWRFIAALRKLPAFKALHFREYRLVWYGQLFGSAGTWMDEVTRGWLIYALTDSVLQLGLVRAVQAVPLLLFTTLAGSAADRYSRKTQLLLAQIANGLIYAVTAVLILTGQIRPWHVYVTAFLMAVAQAFQQPARTAMVSDAVPSDSLTNAIGLNSIVYNVARSTGPAFAGVLIAVSGTGGAYTVQALFFFLASAWTAQLRPMQRASTRADGHTAQRESFGQSIVEGWKFSWRTKEVRAALLCTMLGSLFVVPFTTLLPVFARDILEVGANGQGLLVAAMGVGALCSAVLIASAGDKLPRGALMLGSVTLYGVILVIFSASRWFELSLAMMVIAGLCHVHSNALVQTVIQSYSPSEFRGRMTAIFTMNQVLVTVGSMLIGSLALLIGARWAVACMGAAGSLAMLGIFMTMPHARHIR